MIGMDLLMGGPGAAAQSIAGAVVGHFWYWGVWGGRQGSTSADGVLAEWGKAPQWMRSLLGETGPRPPPSNVGGSAGGVRAIPPRRNLATGGGGAGQSGGSSTGSTSGYNWGPGRALGS